MSLLGLGWMLWLGADVHRVVWGDGSGVLMDALIGAGAGLPIVAITFWLRDWPPMKALSKELGGQMELTSGVSIAILALVSSVGEELFFRGGMHAWLGFWPTVIIFGALHGGFSGRLRVWSVFATLAGMLLGALFEFTDNLLAPTICHFTVNYFNLHQLMRTDSPPAP